ncbi:hypothetical protein LWI29_034299 [Acer saccharum]|uniref:Uncharacterized protein n=1 Tax=Acer saccharum TaxID=4024 RepID=A0AA39SUA5_ACESA|nr:hypothetical protein LWI29_034299 [Acer saccharum]
MLSNSRLWSFLHYDEVRSIEIAALCIKKISLWFSKREPSYVIDISKSPLLKYLDLKDANFLDEEFDSIVSKYPLLESLFVSRCNFLEKVIISSIQLKKLKFVNCSSLKDIDIDTPNLVSFYYKVNSVPKSSINAPCSWDVRFENEGALNTSWFLYVKDFLGVNQVEDLFITLKSEKISFKLDEFRKWSPSFPCEGENLHLDLTMRPSNYTALLDGLFSICYPRYMSIVAYGGDFGLFIKDFFDFVLVTVVKAVATPDLAVELPLTTENVENVLDEVRPYLIADRGSVALHEIDGNIVQLKLQGVGSRVSKCVYLLFLPLLVFVEYVKD